MVATLLFSMLALPRREPHSMRDEPLPPSEEALGMIVKAAGLPTLNRPEPVWRQSQRSWSTVWGIELFGAEKTTEDATLFRFRLAPDSYLEKDGKGRPVFESYRNGLPLYSTGGSGRARPLGFRYGADGYCTNVSISVSVFGNWRRVRLSPRETTIMGRFLSVNEYSVDSRAARPARYGKPWIKIEVAGCGDYWIDDAMVCVGPFGAEGQILSEIKKNVQDLIAGGYAHVKADK